MAEIPQFRASVTKSTSFSYYVYYIIAGSHFGLSLTLNVERYQYAPGPYAHDAGIKVGPPYSSVTKISSKEQINQCWLGESVTLIKFIHHEKM